MNSKQRKLKYIRQKNNLRNGGVLIDFYKHSFSATPENQVKHAMIKNQPPD